MESESRTIWDAAKAPCARSRRFYFKARFYAFFSLTHLHLLDFLLLFRDDISGAAACGLTTWDLCHRAGPAHNERAPRPSFQ